MTTAELKEYLGILIDVHGELYTQEKLEETLKRRIDSLNFVPEEPTFEGYCRVNKIDQRYSEIRKEAPKQKPQKPVEPEEYSERPSNVTVILDEKHLERPSNITIAAYVLLCIIFPPAIIGAIILWFASKERESRLQEQKRLRDKRDEAQRAEWQAYYAKLKAYQAELKVYQQYVEDKKMSDKYYEEWEAKKINDQNWKMRFELQKEAYRVVLISVREQKNKTFEKLGQIYSKNIIYPKYRNYAAVCSFYDYIESGRCSTLEGPDGAYNKYDIEVRLDKINAQLDVVIKNLIAIRENQYKLYMEMGNVKNKITELNNSVKQIESGMNVAISGIMALYMQGERHSAQLSAQLNAQFLRMQSETEKLIRNSELNTYFTECNNRQLSYMNRMNYFAGNYDNPYGNYAPV